MHTETHARVAALCEAHDVEQSGDIVSRLAAVAGKVGARVRPLHDTPEQMLAAIDDASPVVEAEPEPAPEPATETGEGDPLGPFGPFGGVA